MYCINIWAQGSQHLVSDHFHTDLQAFSTDITDDLILVSEFRELCHQIGAHTKAVLLGVVLSDCLLRKNAGVFFLYFSVAAVTVILNRLHLEKVKEFLHQAPMKPQHKPKDFPQRCWSEAPWQRRLQFLKKTNQKKKQTKTTKNEKTNSNLQRLLRSNYISKYKIYKILLCYQKYFI